MGRLSPPDPAALLSSARLLSRSVAILLASSTLSLAGCTTAPNPAIPPRPELLHLQDLPWQPPDPDQVRFQLSNGIPVYAVADHELPLVTVTVLFRGGTFLVPEGREGLADLTSALWPAGGAGDRGAEDLDDDLARLAAETTASIGDTSGRIALDVLSTNLEPALELFRDILARPRFAFERFEQARADALQALRDRGDDPEQVEEREWLRLVYGEGSWQDRQATASSLAAVEPGDCRSLVDRLMRAGNVAVAVAGDFEPTAVTGLLEAALGGLPPFQEELPTIPQPSPPSAGGVWLLDWPGSVQARVTLGHQGLPMGHPDEIPLLAVNQVLGGSFSSRLVSRIRSEEGLAYDVHSLASFPPGYPGAMTVAFQTSSSTCAHATAIAVEVFRHLRHDEVSPAELERAREALLARVTERFGSAATAALAMAEDDLDGRPPGYWYDYLTRVAALTAADLRSAAERHLDPTRLQVLVIGDRQAIEEGHPDHVETLEDLGLGAVQVVPERDPLTLQPIPAASGPP